MIDPDSKELLVILALASCDEVRSKLESDFQLLQIASPRVLTVTNTPQALAEIASRQGVVLATKDQVPSTVLEELNANEKMWIAGWQLRKQPKQRIGEGLSWDAPGFQPPDRKG